VKRILIVFGTRPEAIKMAPVIKKLDENKDNFDYRVCVTAQHREMLDQVLNFFDINVDYDLDLMKPNQNLSSLTSLILEKIRYVFDDYNPSIVLVHGDTTTTMACSLSAFYHGSILCHVEAGLRTNNKFSPYPEEINRRITSVLADYHFSPTQKSKDNLLNENINSDSIIVTGNTVIDALFIAQKKVHGINNKFTQDIIKFTNDFDIILITIHRRENHGENLINICTAILELAMEFTDKFFVYPVHMNPKVSIPVKEKLAGIKNIILIDPLKYQDFIWLMNKSKLIITDSGGIQEEAPSLGKPVLVVRDTTERPEAISVGTVILVGTNKSKIIDESKKLLNNKSIYDKMTRLHNPYGDGKASERIIDFLKKIY
tara:strand:- start:4408 stop:5526 length:1119 start_codon:yes stop_codon:yes gene_type:complete